MRPRIHRKYDFPVDRTREHLEPGPIVLVTAKPATKVDAPLVSECYASFECRLADGSQIAKRGLFIWEVVKAHVARVKQPETLHYRGQGVFTTAHGSIKRRRLFQPDRLE